MKKWKQTPKDASKLYLYNKINTALLPTAAGFCAMCLTASRPKGQWLRCKRHPFKDEQEERERSRTRGSGWRVTATCKLSLQGQLLPRAQDTARSGQRWRNAQQGQEQAPQSAREAAPPKLRGSRWARDQEEATASKSTAHRGLAGSRQRWCARVAARGRRGREGQRPDRKRTATSLPQARGARKQTGPEQGLGTLGRGAGSGPTTDTPGAGHPAVQGDPRRTGRASGTGRPGAATRAKVPRLEVQSQPRG